MKILLVCEKTLGYGGWYTYARDLRDTLRARGHTVVTCGRRGEQGINHPVLPGPVAMLTSPWKALSYARTFAAVLRQEQPDVIHIVVEPYALMIPFLPKQWRGRTVLTIHGSYGIRPIEYPLSRALAKKYYAEIGAFITVSNYTKTAVHTELEKRRWSSAARFAQRAHIVYNGIKIPSQSLRTHKNDEKRILLVGSVKPRKGVLEAVEACAAYKRVCKTPFRFVIAGTLDDRESYVQKVRAKIDELGLRDHVVLLGAVEDATLIDLYRNADLFLMPALTAPNTFEGFGLVYIEANAWGVPAIGPNDSGAAEAIVDGRNGYRVNPRDPASLAKHMQWILDEHRIRPEDCRAWAEHHSIENAVERIIGVYEGLQA